MKRYELPTFRPVFGLAAAAMTAVTMAAAVVLPVTLACTPDLAMLASETPVAAQAAPLRIEVVGKRTTTLTAAGSAVEG